MQCGSTGLGKMALKMRLVDKREMTKLPPTDPPEDSFVMYCKTYDPVVWSIWIGIEPEDVGAMVRMAFRKETLAFVFKSLFRLLFSKLGFKKESNKNIAAQAETLKTA